MNFNTLIGKTLRNVEVLEERIVFTQENGTTYASYHMQACCESLHIEKIIGDVNSVLGSPIMEAEETEDRGSGRSPEPYTWTKTKQRIRTATGEVTFVWSGLSNGCYRETPHFGLTHNR
jgi:hypothetical protein